MTITLTLDRRPVTAEPGETVWDVARRCGTTLPHLCHRPAPGYRADGNCRACVVEIEGERVLAPSCRREVADGMVVTTDSERVRLAQRMVFELLAADLPEQAHAPDPKAEFWRWAETFAIRPERLPGRDAHDVSTAMPGTEAPLHDASNPAIAVNLDSCIACGLCVRACREVQHNDVLGMADRGHAAVPVFDIHDPMGASTCVTCGECVQACPTGALYEKSLMDEAAERRTVAEFDREVESVCPFCGVGCQTTVRIKDDRIVQVDGRAGPANENRLCVKGRFGFDYVHSPERLTVPLIRREDAPKRGDAERPAHWSELFREATWEEALERAAGGLATIRDAHGGNALAGFGSAKGSNEEAYLFQKLVRTGFGTNNVDHCTRLCHASSVAALLEGVGSGAVSAPFTDALKADCIVVIGARPATNHPVAATYFKEAAARGARMIVMDPRGQELMRHASHPVRFEPGTDVALLNAMLHTIIAERLFDEQYVQARVDGFEALRDKVAEFSPEAMAPVCGVPAETIREIARTYATAERSIIFWGMGVSQHTHGTDNARGLIALALVTGHVGRPGTGLHPLRGQNNVQGASDAGLIPMFLPDYQPVDDPDVRARYEDAWKGQGGRSLDPKRGLTVVEIMDAIHAGSIRGMYVMGENPAMSDPDQTHARAALAALDHLVVQDIVLTETAWHADVVLPATAHAEKLGTTTNTNRQVQIGRPCVPPPGTARQDWEIVRDLANGLGLDWAYDGVPEVYAEMASLMPSLANIPWERLEREAVTYPVREPGAEGKAVVFEDGFPTATGRARIVPTDLKPPAETPDAEFPLVLTTGRLLEHWHTGAMTRPASVLDAIEPDGFASMHPDEIERMGLEAGGWIEVATRRGTVTALLRADREVARGMVFMPFCFAESPANRLTNPMLDPYGKIPEFKHAAARVRRVEAVRDAAE